MRIALALLLIGCSGSASQRPRDPVVAAVERCEVNQLEAKVTVTDHAHGATISFVTGGQNDRLRARVFEIADVHNEVHAEMGPLPEEGDAYADNHAHQEVGEQHDEIFVGTAGGAAPSPGVEGPGPAFVNTHSRARPEEIQGGAQIVFISDVDDVEELREEVRDRAAEIDQQCNPRSQP